MQVFLLRISSDKKEIPMQRNNRLFNMKDMVEDIKQLDQTTFQVTLQGPRRGKGEARRNPQRNLRRFRR